MTVTTTGARHRADRRPKTALSTLGETLAGSRAVRRTVLAAATSSLAITMAATTASAASPADPVPQAGEAALTAEASAPAASASGATHTVRAGDTVAELAHRYGSTISGIIDANGLNAQALIRVGETLTIPGSSATSRVSSAAGGSSDGPSVQTTSAGVDRSGSAASRSSARSAPASSSGSAIVNIARQYIGTPYAWGGSTPAAFDCSGFTSYVYAQAGISLPRSSSAQLNAGTRVSASAAQPGDLVWWPGHVGIYVGDGQYIAAHSPGNPLSVRDIYKSNPTFIRVA